MKDFSILCVITILVTSLLFTLISRSKGINKAKNGFSRQKSRFQPILLKSFDLTDDIRDIAYADESAIFLTYNDVTTISRLNILEGTNENIKLEIPSDISAKIKTAFFSYVSSGHVEIFAFNLNTIFIYNLKLKTLDSIKKPGSLFSRAITFASRELHFP
ncbi:hypothetical protein ACQ86N_02625 [Puia sp. P3]|uniref:hypothetical protein n=1 Tax=Puia sp. P3 TaxID=3423952 RepID=UPI003D66D6B5